MNFELQIFELREMNFGLRLKFGLREINLSCEVLDSHTSTQIVFTSIGIGSKNILDVFNVWKFCLL